MFSETSKRNNRSAGLRIAILLTLVMLLTSTSAMVAAAPTDDSDNVSTEDRDAIGNERIDYREQEVRVLKEPDNQARVSIRVGEAVFSVRWGEDSASGAVELVTVQRRYLGVADIYDEDGEFEGRIGIPVEKMFRMDLTGIIEYADRNSDGMFDVESTGGVGNLNEILTDQTANDDVYKYVDLRDAEWSLRDWDNSSDTDSRNRDISFTLVAENITYQGVLAGTMSDSTSKLDAVEITFRGTTREEVIDIESVPHFRVDTERGANDEITVKESRKIASSDVTGHVLNMTWEFDLRIRGWDGVRINDTLDGNDSRLFAVTEVMVAERIDERVDEWMRDQFDNAVDPRAVVGHAKRKIADDSVGATHDKTGRLNVCAEGKVTEIDASGERVEMTPLEYEQAAEQHKEDMKPEDQRDAEAKRDNRSDSESSVEPSGEGGTEGTEARTEDADGVTTDDDKANKSRRERLLDAAEHVYDRVTGDCADHGELRSDAVRRATAIRGGGLHFDDSDAELGRLRWVNNVTIREEGEELDFEVVYQVHSRRDASQADLPKDDTDHYRGVRLIGGFNYPVAEEINHDPEFGSDIVTINASDPVFKDTTDDDQAADDNADDGSSSTDGTGGSYDEEQTKSSEGIPGFTGLIATTALFGAVLFGRRSNPSGFEQGTPCREPKCPNGPD